MRIRKWWVIISYFLDSELFERNWTTRIISYFDDYETFERDWIARNISYIDDFETDKNLSHKEKFLFYGPYCTCPEGQTFLKNLDRRQTELFGKTEQKSNKDIRLTLINRHHFGVCHADFSASVPFHPFHLQTYYKIL